MAQLSEREPDEKIERRERERVRRHGRSTDAEVRAILGKAEAHGAIPARGLGSRIAERFRGEALDVDLSELRGRRFTRADLER